MELLTILVSGLIGLVSPTGVIVDRVAEAQIRQQLVSVEQLQVRVDNAPSYQLINGRVDRVRVAGRGLFPLKEFRIDTLELDTDPIFLNLQKRKLEKPLQVAARMVLTERDINQALQSPTVTAQLKNLGIRFLQRREAQAAERYDFLNLRVTFLPKNRIRIQGELREQGYPETLKIVAEANPKIINGRSLQLDNLNLTANGQPTPATITRAIAKGISDRIDLRKLELSGTTARILNFKIDAATLQVITFVQIRPSVEK